MKKPIGKYLKFYYDSIKNKRIPMSGLCCTFDFDDIFEEFIRPTTEELQAASDKYDTWVWCETHRQIIHDPCGKFNELRQTVVLLMAAINNEL